MISKPSAAARWVSLTAGDEGRDLICSDFGGEVEGWEAGSPLEAMGSTIPGGSLML